MSNRIAAMTYHRKILFYDYPYGYSTIQCIGYNVENIYIYIVDCIIVSLLSTYDNSYSKYGKQSVTCILFDTRCWMQLES